MKSLKAEGDKFLELTELLRSTSNRRDSPGYDGSHLAELLEQYSEAAASLSFGCDRRLKNAAEYLHNETLRLSMTSSKHLHHQQLSSNQDSAKKMFARKIAALIERN